jgi:hypothetical protein
VPFAYTVIVCAPLKLAVVLIDPFAHMLK